MAKKPNPAGGKATGYKNPPKHTQWKKGQSGNPSGKATKQASIEAKLKKLASMEIVKIKMSKTADKRANAHWSSARDNDRYQHHHFHHLDADFV